MTDAGPIERLRAGISGFDQVAVIQTRGSAHDPRVRRVAVDGRGIHIAEPIAGITSVLPGEVALKTRCPSPYGPGSREAQPDC